MAEMMPRIVEMQNQDWISSEHEIMHTNDKTYDAVAFDRGCIILGPS